MKAAMMEHSSSASHSFLLDDDSTLPFSAADILAQMDDKVCCGALCAVFVTHIAACSHVSHYHVHALLTSPAYHPQPLPIPTHFAYPQDLYVGLPVPDVLRGSGAEGSPGFAFLEKELRFSSM